MNNGIISSAWPLTLAVFLLLGAGCSTMPAKDPLGEFSEEKRQIEHRLEEIFAAAVAKDFARLDSYHLYGPKFTKFSGSSLPRQDADAGRKGEHEGLGSINGLKMKADALKVDVFGTVGVATFILDYSFETAGKTVHARERTTMVFVKDDESWKIVHEHLSPINP
jgi:ketosteroid isomerase-like protein